MVFVNLKDGGKSVKHFNYPVTVFLPKIKLWEDVDEWLDEQPVEEKKPDPKYGEKGFINHNSCA